MKARSDLVVDSSAARGLYYRVTAGQALPAATAARLEAKELGSDVVSALAGCTS